MTQLHYYRCVDCLSIATATDYQPRGECGLCSGALEYMGRVQGARLVETKERCKCDGRCVFARGPDCECSCCGENHGSGWYGGGFYVATTDRGPVPRLRMPDNAKAATIAEEWRAGLAELRSATREAERTSWVQYLTLSEVLYKVKKSRCHKNRMAAIARALPDYQTTTRPELQAALF